MRRKIRSPRRGVVSAACLQGNDLGCCDLAGFTHLADSLRIKVEHEIDTLVRDHSAVVVEAHQHCCAGSVREPSDRAIFATASTCYRYAIHGDTIQIRSLSAYRVPSDSRVGVEAVTGGPTNEEAAYRSAPSSLHRAYQLFRIHIDPSRVDLPSWRLLYYAELRFPRPCTVAKPRFCL